LPEPPRAGLTSAPADPNVPEVFYRACGYHVCGPRAVRIDILERLADLIRPLLAWRPNPENPSATPPKGSTGDGGFVVIPEMMSILGCSPDELSAVFTSLGFRLDRRPVKPAPAPELPAGLQQPGASGEAQSEGAVAAEISEPSTDEPGVPTEPLDAAVEGHSAESVAAEPEPTPVETPEVALEDPAEPGDAVPASGVSAADGQPVGAPEPQGAAVILSAASERPAGEAKPAEAEEIKYEDVWRPRRRHNGARPDRRHHRGRHDGGQREERHGQGHQQARPQHQNQRRRDRQPAAAASAAQGGAARHSDAALGGGHKHRDRKDARRDGRRGDDRRRNNERHGASVQIRSAAPPKRGEVDPDSPFAALSALKKA